MEQDEMMNGMPRRERAVMYKSNYNCCQAVLLAYAPELDLPEDRLLAMGACFGSGMGSMDETCGALCGAQMVQGCLLYSFQIAAMVKIWCSVCSIRKRFSRR